MDLSNPDGIRLLAELLAGGAAVRFTVTGASMRPFLAGGETVELRPVPPDRIRPGDLVLFRPSRPEAAYTPVGVLPAEGPQLMLHRVIRIRRGAGLPALIQTQGDALWAPDDPVEEEQVLARVCAVERAGSDGSSRWSDLGGFPWQAVGRLVVLRQGICWRARRAFAWARRLPHDRNSLSARRSPAG